MVLQALPRTGNLLKILGNTEFRSLTCSPLLSLPYTAPLVQNDACASLRRQTLCSVACRSISAFTANISGWLQSYSRNAAAEPHCRAISSRPVSQAADGRSQTAPRLLMRDFIQQSLYHPTIGYFNSQAPPVGKIPEPINFKKIVGETEFQAGGLAAAVFAARCLELIRDPVRFHKCELNFE